jgi:mannose-6-phosphate isomerase-like protein (cupin superfamily)
MDEKEERKAEVQQVPIPAWIGKFPFRPEEKRFIVIRRGDELSGFYGFEGHQVALRRFVSLDQFTVSQWTLTPGNYYEPAGQHNYGDEIYYFLEGDPVAFAPETGETYQLGAGDALYIPQGTRHQIFGFNEKKVVAISIVAPRIWAAEDKMGTVIPPVKRPRFYKGWEEEGKGAIEHSSHTTQIPNIDSLGRWPREAKEARAAKKIIPVRAEEQLPLIHGKEKHVLFSFVVSNDYINVALLQIPVGGISEAERHKGDELLYALKGDLVVQLEEAGEAKGSAVSLCHHVFQGEKCFIPGGTPHKYLNFNTTPIEGFAVIGPGL